MIIVNKNRPSAQMILRYFKKSLLSFILLYSLSGYSQEYKFGKVSKEELLEASCPMDSTANAVVLYEKRKTYFEGYRLITEVFKRIKLYNKKGFSHASNRVYLYGVKSSRAVAASLKAVTYNLVDGNIVETKLGKDGVFENKETDYASSIRFTMPAIQEGSVIEFKYKLASSGIRKIYLQQRIPIKKLEVDVEVPEYFNFKRSTTGYLPIKLRESIGDGIGYRIDKYNIVSTDVPAFKEEPHAGNVENYLSTISFELQQVRYWNGSVKNFSTTWNAVGKTIYEDSRFGKELEKTDYFKEDIDSLTKGVTNPEERTALIFNYVKKKMTWNNGHNVQTRKGVKKAYQDGVGNSAEINIMLLAMLKYANITADPVLVSSSKRVTPVSPTLRGFDYVIARANFTNGKMIYLDATDKFGEQNVLPERVIHGSGRTINERKRVSGLINFRPNTVSKIYHSMVSELSDDGVIKGKHSTRRTSYAAHNFRVNQGDESEESQIGRIKKKYQINNVKGYKLKGVEDMEKAVDEKFDFTINEQVEIIENEMYFSPLLFLRDEKNIFKSEERKYPIDFGYGYSKIKKVSITIPEGYEVSEIPGSLAFKLPENMGSFVFKTNILGNIIQVSVTETLNTPFVLAKHYPLIKQFYNQIIQKENEQVVLKKI